MPLRYTAIVLGLGSHSLVVLCLFAPLWFVCSFVLASLLVVTGVECYDTRYWSWAPIVLVSALAVAFGVPALFGYLLYHYKEVGKAGDPVVQPVKILQRTFPD